MIKRQISFLFEDPGFCIDVFCTIAEPVRYYNRDTESGAWYSSTPDWNENGSLIREDLIFEVIADGVVCALDGNGNFEGKVNLRDLYPDVYKNDYFVEVTEDVLETIRAAERAEAAYDRRMYRYKAYYSLDCDNGIENAILMKPQTPEMLLEEKQLREQLYAAVMALPEKQAKRIYARYYLGMRVSEIATAEGVDPSRVRDSIRRGLKQLAKYF